MKNLTPNIGITAPDRKKVAEALKVTLADTYVLYTKTQVFHWNVTAREFYMFHKMFEAQYEELSDAVDQIAERIRSLGEFTQMGLKDLLSNATLEEAKEIPNVEDMLVELLNGHEHLIQKGRDVIKLAEEAGDDGTADFITAKIEEHEKTAWMLRSSIEG